MNKPKSERVAALERKVDKIRLELLKAEQELSQALLDECGVRAGDVVLHKGQEFRVAKVEPRSWGGAWLMVNPKKKDGTFGLAERRVFDGWTVVKRAE